MKWKDLNGEARYRVVQMVREGKVSIKALCRSFGVSRQSLRTAVDKADQAAMEALTPKSPGRKSKSKEQAEVEAMKGPLEAEVRNRHDFRGHPQEAVERGGAFRERTEVETPWEKKEAQMPREPEKHGESCCGPDWGGSGA